MAAGAPLLPAPEVGSCVRAREHRRIGPAPGRGVQARVALDRPQLESKLVALARSGAPLRRALARLAGRMEALRGGERIGWARRRDYASERLGISGRQLQELARMDRAFAGLAALECAFVSGCLSWTKARLLARVATAEDAEAWIAHAASATARELSREVRALDARARDLLDPESDEDGQSEDEEKETVFVRCTPAVKAKWHRARFWAARIEGHPVPPWAAAERLAAEALSAVPMDAAVLHRIETERAAGERIASEPAAGQTAAAVDSERAAASVPAPFGHGLGHAGVPQPRSPNGCASEDPLLPSLLERLEEADPFELDARLRRALAAEQRLISQMGPLLLGLVRGRAYRSYECSSLGAFAREWLGMSPSKADSLVRLERACEIAPPLREAYRAGRLSWAQARLLVPLLRREDAVPWQPAWVAHAQRVSVRRLGDEVSHALARGAVEPPPLDSSDGRWADGSEDAADREFDDGSGDAQAADDWTGSSQTRAHGSDVPRTMTFFFTAPRDVARLFRGALAAVQRRIERRSGRTVGESEALDAILEHAFETWGLTNARLRREHRVFDRDGWRCTFPGCTSYGNLHDHHIEYRSRGGSDDLSNRTTLCAWHHQRGEHAKVVRCRGKAPERLRFALGLRAGRPPLARYRSGDVVVA